MFARFVLLIWDVSVYIENSTGAGGGVLTAHTIHRISGPRRAVVWLQTNDVLALGLVA